LVAIVVVVLFYDPVRKRLDGPSASLLGRLSFPVYLAHLPILCGLVVPIHSSLADRFGSAAVAPPTFALFVVLALIAAYPLARLDAWWVGKLRAVAAVLAAMLQRTSRRFGNLCV
jgi:peptidoglycan/LPS O-acetylase OafA/YrhL